MKEICNDYHTPCLLRYLSRGSVASSSNYLATYVPFRRLFGVIQFFLSVAFLMTERDNRIILAHPTFIANPHPQHHEVARSRIMDPIKALLAQTSKDFDKYMQQYKPNYDLFVPNVLNIA